jgi:hypothetical protein
VSKRVSDYYLTVHREHVRLGFRSGNCPICKTDLTESEKRLLDGNR